MARGRHAKRTGLLARLWPRRRRTPERAVPVDLMRMQALEGEVARLRVLGIAHAAAAASADLRSRRAEEQLAASLAEVAALRCDLAALREELVWAFAERKLTVPVVDLRDEVARTA